MNHVITWDELMRELTKITVHPIRALREMIACGYRDCWRLILNNGRHVIVALAKSDCGCEREIVLTEIDEYGRGTSVAMHSYDEVLERCNKIARLCTYEEEFI